MIDFLLVLGASGDLTGRLLLPAVAELRAAGELSSDFRLVGADLKAWSTNDFVGRARARLAEHAPSVAEAGRDAFLDVLRYRQVDVADPADVAAVLEGLLLEGSPAAPVAVYLALPTQLMLGAVRALAGVGLPAGSRIAIEKPFGVDGGSAAELNAALAEFDGSAQQRSVYRVDHALAMTAVQALPRACFPGTDRRIEWSSRQVDQIDLLWEETLALEGRASFYDRAGALRDVMQNHLVQVLCTIAAPGDAEDTDGRPERHASVLRSVRPLDAVDVRTRTRRARYSAGRLADTGGADARAVPDYVAEPGVDPGRGTETFAEVILELDTPQWTGTRFVLRTGKALSARRRGVRVRLRPDIATAVAVHGPVWLDVDGPTDTEPGVVEPGVVEPKAAEPAAYRRIVTDLLSGGTSYSVSAAEAELAWQVFTPVLQGWADGAVALTTYPAGSTGPSSTGRGSTTS